MANEPTPTAPETIALAAQALRGEPTPVAKANPFADDEKDKDAKKDVAKAEDPKEEDKKEDVAKAADPEDKKEDVAKALSVLLAPMIAEAVRAEFADMNAEIAEVRKSLGVVEVSTQATLNFQNATTGILTALKGDVEEQHAVQKSLAATVEAVAAQPAGRKSALADVEVSKSVAVAAGPIDMQPLRDWARGEQYDTSTRVTFVRNAEMGNFSGIPTDVRKAMGVTE